MLNTEVLDRIGKVPYMTIEQANRLTRLVEESQSRDLLELGFFHGVSTCYLAAALDRQGRGGRIVTIDLESAREKQPNVEQLLAKLGLRDLVDVYYEPTSYTWRLMRFLEESTIPRFDLCYLDGAHNWFVDGLAFFLVDKLLRPGGWIILDDLDWTYDGSPTLAQSDWVRKMPAEERTTPQVLKVFDLLVKPHPGYHNFRTEAGWGFAQKKASLSTAGEREIVVERIVEVQTRYRGLGWLLRRMAKRILARHN